MQVEVTLPKLEFEPGTELTVSFWFVENGDEVLEGDRLVEILAGPITFDVPSPVAGRLVELRAVEDDVVQCGNVLAVLETD